MIIGGKVSFKIWQTTSINKSATGRVELAGKPRNVSINGACAERRTCDREVAGSSLTHCAAEYALSKPLTHLSLSLIQSEE